MRVVIAEDELLLRQGVTRLLADAGIDVLAGVDTADALLECVARMKPDAALVDVRMPPTHRDEGIVAAREIRDTCPDTGVLVLSHYLESTYALRLLENHPERCGYLLKERVSDIDELVRALEDVSRGGSALDPKVVEGLMARRSADASSPLRGLTDKEREVLEQMATGRTNATIARTLFMSERSVEKHISSVFLKLGLLDEGETNRRVSAVLTYVEATR
jgi:DNA-binding NarL/FixJ family response regulator